MRKLNEQYWNRFIKCINDEKKVRDGVAFEDLIEQLLQLEFPAQWQRTLKSHDNNRDFYLVTDKNKIWAECKNYKKEIALDVIAPTLVMAQIFSIHKIIFFSYSKINSQAKKKLYAFAERVQKDIYIIDESRLDTLIIKHRCNLPQRFTPQSAEIIESDVSPEYNIEFYYVQNPIIGSTLEDMELIPINNVKKIDFHSVFGIIIFCSARYTDKFGDFKISVDEKFQEVNEKYTIVDKDIKSLSSLNIVKKFHPASGCMFKILLKSEIYQASIVLPQIKAEICSGNHIYLSKKIPYKKVKIIWAKQTPLIGEHYRNMVLDFEQKILFNNELSCFILHGNSGTGKTRILKELSNVLLKNKYKILSFIGNENDSACTVLKEIVYYIFEVPRKEIFEHLEENFNFVKENSVLDISDNNILRAYRLAKVLSDSVEENQLDELINKHFDIVYEKISSSNFAIIIDNLQFFGKPIINFLENYINYSKHQTRSNKSILIMSINDDYACDEIQNFKMYMKELCKDRLRFSYNEIQGFTNAEQAIMYLRELFSISDASLDTEFELIASKSALIPYHIQQIIYKLLDEGIIEYANNRGFISNTSKFYNAIQETDTSLDELIEKRWKLFLLRYNNKKINFIVIIAVLSLLGKIDSICINNFKLDIKTIKLMQKNSFLKISGESFFFDHDLIESFFSRYYNDQCDYLLEYIQTNNLQTNTILYPIINRYYIIKKTQYSADELESIAEYANNYSIPYKAGRFFIQDILKELLSSYSKFLSKNRWLEITSALCNKYRNIIGFSQTLTYYESINQIIHGDISTYFSYSPEFRNYIDTFSNLLHYLKQTRQAIAYLNAVLKNIPERSDEDLINALKSMIYNRLSINYRIFVPDEYYVKQFKECIKTSTDYAQKIHDNNLKDEFMYLNLSDEGYLYYSLLENKSKLLDIWNKCKEYSPERLPQKELNYYRKMVQLSLIEYDTKTAKLHIDKLTSALAQFSINEHLIFEIFSSMAQCICLIMDAPQENIDLLKNIFTNIMQKVKLRGGNKEYDVLNMKAIVLYYNKEYDNAKQLFSEAYNNILSSGPTMHKKEKIGLIKDNMQQLDVLLQCGKKSKDIIPARGIIQTPDHLFNLPVLV